MAEETRILSIKDVKVGEFIKYSGRDKSGKFHYVGEVRSVEAGWINILTLDGYSMGFHNEGFKDTELHLTDKPVGWDKFVKNPEKAKEKAKEKEEAKREAAKLPVLKTTKEQVFDLVRDNAKLSDNKMLKLVMQNVKGDEATLKMYIALAESKLKKGA